MDQNQTNTNGTNGAPNNNGQYTNNQYTNGQNPNGAYQNGPYNNGPYNNGPYNNGPYKQLRRSRTNRMICGVCGGIGEYLNVDPTLVRIAAVILGFCGAGLVAYIVAAICMPE